MVSGLFGSNLATLFLLRKPSTALSYVQHTLFVWRMVKGHGLPQRQFHELFTTPEHVSLDLLPTTGYLTYWDANYAKDVLYLSRFAHF